MVGAGDEVGDTASMEGKTSAVKVVMLTVGSDADL